MRKITCFVIIPSGKNPPMRLAPDGKLGLCVVPSSCEIQKDEIQVNFQDVYDLIVKDAVEEVNGEIERSAGALIECIRGEDLPDGGSIVSQFLRHVCSAPMTITDLTGLNANVLLEYGIRLSVKDSLNILLSHEGQKLPQDVADQRCITYALAAPRAAKKAREDIVKAIRHGLPALLGEESRGEQDPNLVRRTVELASGRTLERRLATVFEPVPDLVGELVDEIEKLDRSLRASPGEQPRTHRKLSYEAWQFLDALGQTLREDPSGVRRALELYQRMLGLEGFRARHLDIYYKLHEISAADPSRAAEAAEYLRRAEELDV